MFTIAAILLSLATHTRTLSLSLKLSLTCTHNGDDPGLTGCGGCGGGGGWFYDDRSPTLALRTVFDPSFVLVVVYEQDTGISDARFYVRGCMRVRVCNNHFDVFPCDVFPVGVAIIALGRAGTSTKRHNLLFCSFLFFFYYYFLL
uniref:Putative secreted protein n=1 Tax=Anopheles darlingi TaxID=43151 RepID=A0A2M4D6I3_ANODA